MNFQKAYQKDFYEELDPQLYDTCYRAVKRNQIKKIEVIAELAGIQPGDHVLEIGTGTGIHALWLAERGVKVTCLDIATNMLSYLKKKSSSESLKSKILPVVGDAERLPFSDGVFDHTECTALLHHLPKPLKALKEMLRVTKRNGTISVAEPNITNPLILYQYLFCVDRELELGMLQSYRRKIEAKFLEAGMVDIKSRTTVFVPPINIRLLIGIFSYIEKYAERLPIINKFGGSIVVTGMKH